MSFVLPKGRFCANSKLESTGQIVQWQRKPDGSGGLCLKRFDHQYTLEGHDENTRMTWSTLIVSMIQDILTLKRIKMT